MRILTISKATWMYGTILTLALSLCATEESQAVDPYIPQQLVWRGEESNRVFEILEEFDLSMLRMVPATEVFLLDLQPFQDVDSMAALIAAQSGVIYCTPNYLLSVPEPVQTSQPFVDMVRSENFTTQSAASMLGLEEIHSISTGANVRIAVIDGGIAFGHEVFAGSAVSGYDYIDESSLAYDEAGGASSGHGTFIAGIIKLVAPNAEIVSYRVLDTAGHGNGFHIAMAIVRAVNEGCRIINLSMVMTDSHFGVRDAIDYAYDNGVVVVTAAGNDSSNVQRFPANHAVTLSVASVDLSMEKSNFSNFGIGVDICAPGDGLYGPFGDTAYAWWQGTSFATPFVSAQAALIYESRADANPNIVAGIIRSTGFSLDAINPSFKGQLGAGLLDLGSGLDLSSELFCGDADGNGSFDIADVTFLLAYIFGGGSPPDILVEGDPDGSGAINIGDVVYSVDRIFIGGPEPVCVFSE